MNKKYLHDFTPEKIFCCIFTQEKKIYEIGSKNNLFCLTHDSPEPVCQFHKGKNKKIFSRKKDPNQDSSFCFHPVKIK